MVAKSYYLLEEVRVPPSPVEVISGQKDPFPNHSNKFHAHEDRISMEDICPNKMNQVIGDVFVYSFSSKGKLGESNGDFIHSNKEGWLSLTEVQEEV